VYTYRNKQQTAKDTQLIQPWQARIRRKEELAAKRAANGTIQVYRSFTLICSADGYKPKAIKRMLGERFGPHADSSVTLHMIRQWRCRAGLTKGRIPPQARP
jgi:hypothetical protein